MAKYWPTSEIMKNLYENLANEMMKDEALRQAKLQYMKTAKGVMAHPAFWSPFIMMGKTNPLYIQRKGNPIDWAIGIGVLALLGICGLAYRKRAT
jgi:hypothetical protein